MSLLLLIILLVYLQLLVFFPCVFQKKKNSLLDTVASKSTLLSRSTFFSFHTLGNSLHGPASATFPRSTRQKISSYLSVYIYIFQSHYKSTIFSQLYCLLLTSALCFAYITHCLCFGIVTCYFSLIYPDPLFCYSCTLLQLLYVVLFSCALFSRLLTVWS